MIRAIVRYPGGLLLGAMAASYFVFMSMYYYNPPIACYLPANEKVVALTIDDGPDPVFTPQILKVPGDYKEIKNTNGIIYKITGKNVNWFRPPRGKTDLRVVKAAEKQGLKTILWSLAVETDKISNPEKMARRIIEKTKPGSIILLHDGRLNRSGTVKECRN